jgi:signal transduction histidine kinase
MMSIRVRITLFGLAVVLGVLACFSGAIYGLLLVGVPGGQDQQLAARAAEAALEIQRAPDLTPSRPLTPVQPAVDNDIFVIVLDDSGRPIAYTGGTDPTLPAELLADATAHGTAKGTVRLDGVPVRVAVQTWTRDDLRTKGFVVAGQSVRRQAADVGGVLVVLVISAIVTLGAAALAIWLVTRRLTKTFNGMLDRLEDARRRTAEALAAQQRFVADASHELRTPLTTIRNNAGFLRANPQAAQEDRTAALADLDAEAVRMTRLVDDLLTLARADGGAPLKPSTVDIGALAHDVCRQAGTQHPDRTIHCAGTPVVVLGDADALTRLLWILLDNAVKHTTPGGNIWVAVTSRGPDAATLEVADDGEGIPPGEEQRIFARFHQADPARRQGGAGLGLSIASWIARAHRGSILAANNDRGGATFTVLVSSVS